MSSSRTILLVEDNPDDVFFMRRAMKEAGIDNPLNVLDHGDQVIEYLSGVGSYADRTQFPIPDLMLLDLKLPRRSGLEVLEWMRQQPELTRFVTIVLTTSKETRDVERAYRLGVNSYLVKPPSASQLKQIVLALKNFWLSFNEYPPLGGRRGP